MITAIIQRFKSQAQAEYLKSLKEASTHEDEDFVKVDHVPEECPICDDLEELKQWIESQTVTRKITDIAIHCTATRTSATASAIKNYWEKNLKWTNPGYHILFHHGGGFTIMADLDRVCNGVRGHNATTIHLSYIGGIDDKGKPVDNRSESQKELMREAVKLLRNKIKITSVKGHRDFPKVAKACPCFDAIPEFKEG